SSPSPSAPPLALLSLHDALPISPPASAAYIIRPPGSLEGVVPDELRSTHRAARRQAPQGQLPVGSGDRHPLRCLQRRGCRSPDRSEEHMSELQSRGQLVCRLLLE